MLGLDRDRQLRPVALDTPEADRLLADLTEEERNASWHLVSPEGRRWSAGDAAPPLTRLLPPTRPLAGILAAAPNATERAYRWVADHRSQLTKLIPERSKQWAADRITRRTTLEAAG